MLRPARGLADVVHILILIVQADQIPDFDVSAFSLRHFHRYCAPIAQRLPLWRISD
jgi:hypothetical protein